MTDTKHNEQAAPADADVLLSLAARCEKEEASRELDLKIANAVFDIEWAPYRKGARNLWGRLRGTDDVKFYSPTSVPAYTSSLDAAVTLVPESLIWTSANKSGHVWVWSTKRQRAHRGHSHVPDEDIYSGAASTPALALCAAALRARAALVSP